MNAASEVALLDEQTVGPYLLARGVLIGPIRSVGTLGGGVSNVVLRVDAERSVVLKQALPRLRVEHEWLADPTRSRAEASALALLHSITPTAVPALLDSDPDHHTVTIAAAPPHWHDWKSELITGVTRVAVAERLGTLLASWHIATMSTPLPEDLGRPELFEQLRLAPYFGTAAARRPELEAPLDALADAIRSRRECLVLGDFSPKNVLVGDDDLWVIDLEVAHRGDPAFDVAFLLTHLAGKARLLPEHAAAFDGLAHAFLAAYGDSPGVADPAHTGRVLGGLLVARAYGSSPLEYLDGTRRDALATAGAQALADPADSILTTWQKAITT